jgi:uncharacterized protein (TIGR02757 family)
MHPDALKRLAASLNAADAAFDRRAALGVDPLGIVRRYGPDDRELVAHLASSLAYGAVAQLGAAITRVLVALGPRPTEAVRAHVFGDFSARDPGFVYRMTRAADVDAWLSALGVQLRQHATLQAAFAAAAGESLGAEDTVEPLTRWVAALRAAMPVDAGRGARVLTPPPAARSAAKRWHLMLRWLVRPDDGADLGAWTVLRPSQLLLPLDTHTARMSTALGLTSRSTVDLRFAREVTGVLRLIDESDPVRFDMALCHLGIAGACLHRWEADVCGPCNLSGTCRWTFGRDATLQPR